LWFLGSFFEVMSRLLWLAIINCYIPVDIILSVDNRRIFTSEEKECLLSMGDLGDFFDQLIKNLFRLGLLSL